MAANGLTIPDHLRQRNFALHVICNSHLDREWTENFQFTRYLTVRFLDSLLDVMREVPEYQFLLDSQTVPLEDYLALRPQREGELRQHVQAGRLWVGPWYTAPDFSCIFGESIVRNLLIGHALARDFGRVMKVGYTPFGFGQVSQLPQIYAGFGIDMIWFYRGVTDREVPGIVFEWQGADGTRAFCCRANRYNFYFGVMRPVSKGGGVKERDYDYRSQQVPIHFCDERRTLEHAILADSQSRDALSEVPQRIVELLEDNTKYFPGDVISFMNGMDTSMPTRLDDQVLRAAQAALPANWKIFYSNLPEYVAALRAEIAAKDVPLTVVHGERRDAGIPGPEATLLGDVITTRPAQKVRNAEAETALTRYAEPLAALTWALGAEYPAAFLHLAWKELCKCHPHDTIAGSGVDQLERDLINRLDQVIGIAETLTQFGMGELVKRIDHSGLGETDIPLVVFNPTALPRSEVVSITVDLPNDFDYSGLEILDAVSRQRVDFALTAWQPGGERVVRDAHDAPTSFFCSRVQLDLAVQDVPPLGYRTYVVRKAPRAGFSKTLIAGVGVLENAHVRLTVHGDGSFDLQDKQRGRTYRGLHTFRDRGEAGDAWISRTPTLDEVVLSKGTAARVSVLHDSPLKATLKIELTLSIPADLESNADHSFTRRSTTRVDLPITSHVTLTRDSAAVDVETVVENHARCHLLQVMFPTGLPARVARSDSAFDVVERKIDRDEQDSYAQTLAPTHPLLHFVDVSDDQAGLAAAVVGLRGYQVTEDQDRAIVLTLLKAFEISMCTVSYRWERRPDQVLSQAPGRHAFRYRIVPHNGDWQGAAVAEAEALNCPLLVTQTGRHKGTLPATQAFVTLTPTAVQLSAVKRAEERDSLLVRVFNPTDTAQRATLTLWRPIRTARLVTLEELEIAGGTLRPAGAEVAFEAGPRKIVTVELTVI